MLHFKLKTWELRDTLHFKNGKKREKKKQVNEVALLEHRYFYGEKKCITARPPELEYLQLVIALGILEINVENAYSALSRRLNTKSNSIQVGVPQNPLWLVIESGPCRKNEEIKSETGPYGLWKFRWRTCRRQNKRMALVSIFSGNNCSYYKQLFEAI